MTTTYPTYENVLWILLGVIIMLKLIIWYFYFKIRKLERRAKENDFQRTRNPRN